MANVNYSTSTSAAPNSIKPSPFISAAALRQRLAQKQPVSILFVSDGAAIPDNGIPNSIQTELAHYAGPGGGERGRLPLPDRHTVRAWLEREGILQDADIVVYDAGNGSQAARAWWVLSWVGLPRVFILDGGLKAWHANAEDDADTQPLDATVYAPELPNLDTADIARNPAGFRLIDARAKTAFDGDGTAPAHLPGAVNSPAATWQDANGRLLPRAERLARAEALGLLEDDGRPVVAYCGAGVAAAYWIAATHDLNVPASLYAGSWSAWSANPERIAAAAGGNSSTVR